MEYIGFTNWFERWLKENDSPIPENLYMEMMMLLECGVTRDDLQFAVDKIRTDRRVIDNLWGYVRTVAFCHRAERRAMLVEAHESGQLE